MNISRDTVVLLRYKLSDVDGTVLEDELDGSPVALLHGHGNVIPGLERAILGHAAGDTLNVTIPPEDAYGPRQENQTQRVSKKYFAQPKRLRPGMQTHLQTDQGQRLVTVVKVGGKVIDVDLNHPLAGQTLQFYIEIDEVRAATPTELAHKHAHADGQDHI